MPGQQVEARVVDISIEKRRLTLSMERKIVFEEIDLPSVGTLLETHVERVISSGIIVRIKEGLTGFIPNVRNGYPERNEPQQDVSRRLDHTGGRRFNRSGPRPCESLEDQG